MRISNITGVQPEPAHNDTATIWYHCLPDEFKGRTQGGWLHFVSECTVERGVAAEPHSHEDFDEFYYILNGKGVMTVASEEAAVSAGDFIHVPATAVHSLRTAGPNAPIHLIVLAIKLAQTA
jgi:quercetin dioxygenase-like cupin family protein